MKRKVWPGYLLTTAAAFLILFLALFSAVFTVAETFALTVSFSHLLRLCLLGAAVAAGVYNLPRASLRAGLAVLLCGLLALYVWWRWDTVMYGAQVVFHQITYGFHEEIPSLLYYELPQQLSQGYQRQAAAVFFTAAVPLLALWLGPWLTLSLPVWPAVGTTAALVGLPLFILRQPSSLILGALLLFLTLVILSRRGYRESPVTGAGRVLVSLLPAALVLTLLGAAIPTETDPRPVWLEDLRLAVQSIPAGGISIGVGGVSETIPGRQSFDSVGPLHFTGRTVLQINSSSAQSPLYLRGFSAGWYTAEGWEAVVAPGSYPGQSSSDAPLLLPWRTQPYGDAETVRITDLSSHTRYCYLPYYPTALPTDGIYVDDSYLTRPSDVDEYHVSFLPQRDADLTARLVNSKAESEYRSLAYRNYLDVPYVYLSDEAAAMIRGFAAGHALPSYDPGETVDHTDAVRALYDLAGDLRAYLSSFTEYDQKTPRTPEGEDFVSWFLTESHRGYCVHYASAAVLFLRACGIPARYAAGYVARPGRANAVTNVPDRNAHAWAEVYVDGFGWQPVDVTPGFSGGGTLDDPNYADPEESPSPTPTPSAAVPTPTPTPSAPSPTPSRAPAAGRGPSLHTLLPLLFVLLGVAAAVGLVYLQYFLRRRRLAKKCADPDPNRAVIVLYRYLTALERRTGVACPPQALALAQKACFSQHTITGEERSAMETLARAANHAAGELPFFKRLLLRFFWALL